MLALSIVCTYAIARFPNAAAGDYATIGAYATFIAYTKLGVGIVVAGLLGGLAIAVLSVFFYWAVFRRIEGQGYVAALLASIGIAMLSRNTLTYALGHDPLVFPVPLQRAFDWGGVYVQPTDAWLALMGAAVLAAVFALFHATSIGRQMRALADSRDLARASGIDVDRVLVAQWLVAGFIAAAAGVMLGIKSVIQPESGWTMLLAGFAAAILGGLTSLPGAVVGGLLIGVTQELSVNLVGGSYKLTVPFFVILGVLLVRPEGIFGRSRAAR
ncbi:MAG: branched-chain amino acid ABC transporter permease [Burkholderiales bacterium]